MKKGDKVVVRTHGYLFPNYDTMAKELRATKWKQNVSVANGRIGVIKNIGRDDSRMIALVDIGDREILIDIDGLNLYRRNFWRPKTKQKKAPKKRKKSTIQISVEVFNILSKTLKNFMKREGEYPVCFLLGKNKNDILTQIVRLYKASGDYDECKNMVTINTSTIAKASIKIYKEHAVPCGIARVGNFDLHSESMRGSSLSEVGAMGGFILSMTKNGIAIERKLKDQPIRDYKYKIVMNGKKNRIKSKKGRR